MSGRAEDSRNVEHLGRVVRDPARAHAQSGVRLIPAQTVEADSGRGIEILYAQRELIVPANYDYSQRAYRELRGFLGIIREQSLLLRSLTVDQKILGKPFGRRQQSQRALILVHAHDANVRRSFGRDLNLVVFCAAKTVVAVFEPAQGNQRKPTFRSLEVGRPLRTPREQIPLP